MLTRATTVKRSSPTKLALVDGDVLVYSSSFSAEKMLYELHLVEKDSVLEKPARSFQYKADLDAYLINNGIEEYEVRKTLLVEPVEHALHNVKTMISSIKEKTNSTDMVIFLTGRGNFRKKVATYKEYKGNRVDSRVPQHKAAVTDYLVNFHKALVVDGQEADDAMGIWQSSSEDNSTIICSSDKDMLQIAGNHFRFGNNSWLMQDAESADKHFFYQIMTGDSTDNISGCPGVGYKTAQKFYDPEIPWESVLLCYRTMLPKKPVDGLVYSQDDDTLTYTPWNSSDSVTVSLRDFALEQAKLVRIRREENEYWEPHDR